MVRPVVSLVTTASQTCVWRPRCAGVQRHETRSPTRADERKLLLSSIVVNDAPSGDGVAAADRGAGVSEGDHGRREQEPGAGDQVRGHVDVTQHEILRRVIEHAAQLSGHERREELGRAARAVDRIRGSKRVRAAHGARL